jgi:hypothetical protein
MVNSRTLYINGDSQTCGITDVIDPDNDAQRSYASHLASKIGYRIVANQAIGGGSNDRIFRLTEKYLYECELGIKEFPDFILLGFTECDRFDWVVNGNYVTLGQAAHYSITTEEDILNLSHEEGKRIYPERSSWHQNVLTGRDSMIGILYYNYNRMINLHNRLEHLKIPHLFLNAHLGFNDVHPETNPGRGYPAIFNYLKYDWDNTFWNVHDANNSSFVTWAINNGFECDDGWHPEHQAHKDFSELLYEYVNKHNLLTKYN